MGARGRGLDAAGRARARALQARARDGIADAFGAAACATTLWALARLRAAPSADLLRAFERAMPRIAGAARQHVANALWALATLEYDGPAIGALARRGPPSRRR